MNLGDDLVPYKPLLPIGVALIVSYANYSFVGIALKSSYIRRWTGERTIAWLTLDFQHGAMENNYTTIQKVFYIEAPKYGGRL